MGGATHKWVKKGVCNLPSVSALHERLECPYMFTATECYWIRQPGGVDSNLQESLQPLKSSPNSTPALWTATCNSEHGIASTSAQTSFYTKLSSIKYKTKLFTLDMANLEAVLFKLHAGWAPIRVNIDSDTGNWAKSTGWTFFHELLVQMYVCY